MYVYNSRYLFNTDRVISFYRDGCSIFVNTGGSVDTFYVYSREDEAIYAFDRIIKDLQKGKQLCDLTDKPVKFENLCESSTLGNKSSGVDSDGYWVRDPSC